MGTDKVFVTATRLLKKHQSFDNFKTEIYPQEPNGHELEQIIHANVAYASITNHIS